MDGWIGIFTHGCLSALLSCPRLMFHPGSMCARACVYVYASVHEYIQATTIVFMCALVCMCVKQLCSADRLSLSDVPQTADDIYSEGRSDFCLDRFLL